jgi:glucose/mannose transport system permease protein
MANAQAHAVAHVHGASGIQPKLDLARIVLYAVLFGCAVVFLLPVYVMVVNSFKPLDEIRSGNLMSLPIDWTIAPWLSAWSTAQIGVQPTGLRPFFINSFLLVIPAVVLST